MLLGATNAGREGLPSYMRQRIAPLVSPNVTQNGQEPMIAERTPPINFHMASIAAWRRYAEAVRAQLICNRRGSNKHMEVSRRRGKFIRV